MPASSFDTFFACTILVAAALIGTAFLGSTLQATIASTQDVNKDSYLKAIADHIITSPGAPADWGASSALPSDFGLAASDSTLPYIVDVDKITRLSSLCNYTLPYVDISNAAKLNNIALGITVSQLMTVNISQSSNSTVGSDTSFVFTLSTSIDSNPTAASLHCYVAADNYLTDFTAALPDNGTGQVAVQIPTAAADNALLIVFARASIDDRITSYAIYNFATSTQELTPSSTALSLSPVDYTLSLNSTAPGFVVQGSYVFSYSYQQPLSGVGGAQTPIPQLIDHSPLVLVVFGLNGANFFQEWTAYPQVPLQAGANFAGQEQNVFSYVVTVNGVLYRLDLSLGDMPH